MALFGSSRQAGAPKELLPKYSGSGLLLAFRIEASPPVHGLAATLDSTVGNSDLQLFLPTLLGPSVDSQLAVKLHNDS